MFADVGALFQTPLGAPPQTAILGAMHGSLSPALDKCFRQGLQALRDGVAGHGKEGFVIVARFDEAAFPVTKCLPALSGKGMTKQAKQANQANGDGEMFDFGEAMVAHQPGFLIVGEPNAVKKAVRPRIAPESFPTSVVLQPDEYAIGLLSVGQLATIGGSLEATSERLRMHVEGDMPASEANELDQAWLTARSEIGRLQVSAAESKQVRKMLDATEVRHEGEHVLISLDLREPVAEQARDLGALAALVRAAIRESSTR